MRSGGIAERGRGVLWLAPVLIVILVVPQRAAGIDAAGDWTAWYGCWQPTGTAAPGEVVVCVLPGADAAAVRMVTFDAGAMTEESVLHTDGAPRAVSESGCTGFETANWSRDGRRVFVRTELNCGAVARVSTSVLAFVNVNEFVDAQAVTVNGQHATRSIRYRAVPPENVPAAIAAALAGDRRLATETARLNASTALTLDDVIEAAGRVAPPALEALLAARDHGFALDGRALVRLEEAGVPKSVMNVMIALSYPRKFAVREQAPAAGADRVSRGDPRDYDCWDPYFRTWRHRFECPYAYGYYNRYGYRSRYGYGYGWDPGSYYAPGGWYNDPIVVIIRNDDTRSPGEVVKGTGYTSGGSTGVGVARRRSSSFGGSTGSGSVSSGTTSSSGSSPSSGSSSTGSSGTSTGRSGTSTGRTAVPRGGGGN